MPWVGTRAWARAMVHWCPQDGETENIGNKKSVSHSASGVPLSYTTEPTVLAGSQPKHPTNGGTGQHEPGASWLRGLAAPCPKPSGSFGWWSWLSRHITLAQRGGQPVLRQQPPHHLKLLLQVLGAAAQPRHGSGTIPQRTQHLCCQPGSHQQHGHGHVQLGTGQRLHRPAGSSLCGESGQRSRQRGGVPPRQSWARGRGRQLACPRGASCRPAPPVPYLGSSSARSIAGHAGRWGPRPTASAEPRRGAGCRRAPSPGAAAGRGAAAAPGRPAPQKRWVRPPCTGWRLWGGAAEAQAKLRAGPTAPCAPSYPAPGVW